MMSGTGSLQGGSSRLGLARVQLYLAIVFYDVGLGPC